MTLNKQAKVSYIFCLLKLWPNVNNFVKPNHIQTITEQEEVTITFPRINVSYPNATVVYLTYLVVLVIRVVQSVQVALGLQANPGNLLVLKVQEYLSKISIKFKLG